ncbi:oligosaccharide repeat unit polymerase [Collinsella tanakaei]|nr:oligosaccharide repeat unit polymerase [Collinsella tanakaei]
MTTYLFLLLATELIIWAIAYFVSGYNLASPTMISCAVFMVATLCVIYNIDYWNVNYSFEAYITTSLGLTSMLIGEMAARALTERGRIGSRSSHVSRRRIDSEAIKVPGLITFVLVTLDLVCTVYVTYSVMTSGESSLGLMAIGEAKYGEDGGLSGAVNIAYRYTWLLFIVYTFIYFKNKAIMGKRNRGIKYLIPLVMVCISTFFMGNRANLMRIVCSCYVFWVFSRAFIGDKKTLSIRKVLSRMLPAFVILLVVFYATREITKIGSTTGNRTFIDYITYYIGSPVYLFSSYLDNPLAVHPEPRYFGELTFEGLYNAFGIEITGQAYTLVGGRSNFAGNVYSWLCRPYNDFGLLGALLFTSIVYGLISYVLYGPIAHADNEERRDCIAIVFTYFYYVVFLSFYYCQVCWAVTPSNILYALALVVLYKIAKNEVLIVDVSGSQRSTKSW